MQLLRDPGPELSGFFTDSAYSFSYSRIDFTRASLLNSAGGGYAPSNGLRAAGFFLLVAEAF